VYISIYLKDLIKSELEEKYKIDFNELESISNSIKTKCFIDENLKLLFENCICGDKFISEKVLKRFKLIEKYEYSYVSDNLLYKKIEKAYELWFLLYDYINLFILWNKEVTKTFDNDYKFLKNIANIYLRETDGLVKEIEMRGNHEDKKDTNENLCSYKRKV